MKPVLKSRSRLPPVIVSTVSATTSKFAAMHRSIMLLVTSVLVEVQLEEFWGADRSADFLDAYRSERRNAEHGPELLGSPADRPFHHGGTTAVSPPGAKQGYFNFLAHDRWRQINSVEPGEHIGHQIASLKGFGVSATGHLIISPAVDVVKIGPGKRRFASARKSPMFLHQSIDTRCSPSPPPKKKKIIAHGLCHVEAAREAALLLFNSVYVTVSSGPARALLTRTPLGLHRLRSGSLRFVRRLPSYNGRVQLLAPVHHRLQLLTFPMRTADANN